MLETKRAALFKALVRGCSVVSGSPLYKELKYSKQDKISEKTSSLKVGLSRKSFCC